VREARTAQVGPALLEREYDGEGTTTLAPSGCIIPPPQIAPPSQKPILAKHSQWW